MKKTLVKIKLILKILFSRMDNTKRFIIVRIKPYNNNVFIVNEIHIVENYGHHKEKYFRFRLTCTDNNYDEIYRINNRFRMFPYLYDLSLSDLQFIKKNIEYAYSKDYLSPKLNDFLTLKP